MSQAQRGLNQTFLAGARPQARQRYLPCHTVRLREDLVSAQKVIAGRGLQNDSGMDKGGEKPAIRKHKKFANISLFLGNLSSQIGHASQLALRPHPPPPAPHSPPFSSSSESTHSLRYTQRGEWVGCWRSTSASCCCGIGKVCPPRGPSSYLGSVSIIQNSRGRESLTVS